MSTYVDPYGKQREHRQIILVARILDHVYCSSPA
jgi:hypothetical protein